MKKHWSVVFLVVLALVLAPARNAAQEQQSQKDKDYAKEVEIEELLLEKGGDAALGIKVTVDRTTAILVGEVPTRAAQELAEEVARSVEGIKSVDNRLQVPAGKDKNDAGEETADAYLESRVKRNLYSEIGKRARQIEVEAVDGVVSLRGTVPDESRKKIALDAAAKTKGVKRVVDLIKVQE